MCVFATGSLVVPDIGGTSVVAAVLLQFAPLERAVHLVVDVE